MKQSAFDKIVGLLKKYAIQHTVDQNADVWVSLKSIPNLEPEVARLLDNVNQSYSGARTELSEYLTARKFEFRITRSNFTGYTFWVTRPGMKIDISSPDYKLDFDPNGKFIRAGYHEFFQPGSRYRGRLTPISEVIQDIERRNPENIIKIKQNFVDQYKKQLQDITDKWNEEVNRVYKIRDDVAKIIGLDKTTQVFAVLKSYDIVIEPPKCDDMYYRNQLAEAEKELADYKKSLEWWEEK